MESINATVYRVNQAGNVLSTFGAEVGPDGAILRCSARPDSPLAGTPEFDAYIREEFAPFALRADMDGGAGYRSSLPFPLG